MCYVEQCEGVSNSARQLKITRGFFAVPYLLGAAGNVIVIVVLMKDG